MKFRLDMLCENAAFDDLPFREIARILREAADDVEAGAPIGSLRDLNGNKVGEWKMED